MKGSERGRRPHGAEAASGPSSHPHGRERQTSPLGFHLTCLSHRAASVFSLLRVFLPGFVGVWTLGLLSLRVSFPAVSMTVFWQHTSLNNISPGEKADPLRLL